MFNKKRARVQISAPLNLEHRIHTGYDQTKNTFSGLPAQWNSLLDTSSSYKYGSYLDTHKATPIKVCLLIVYSKIPFLKNFIFQSPANGYKTSYTNGYSNYLNYGNTDSSKYQPSYSSILNTNTYSSQNNEGYSSSHLHSTPSYYKPSYSSTSYQSPIKTHHYGSAPPANRSNNYHYEDLYKQPSKSYVPNKNATFTTEYNSRPTYNTNYTSNLSTKNRLTSNLRSPYTKQLDTLSNTFDSSVVIGGRVYPLSNEEFIRRAKNNILDKSLTSAISASPLPLSKYATYTAGPPVSRPLPKSNYTPLAQASSASSVKYTSPNVTRKHENTSDKNNKTDSQSGQYDKVYFVFIF